MPSNREPSGGERPADPNPHEHTVVLVPKKGRATPASDQADREDTRIFPRRGSDGSTRPAAPCYEDMLATSPKRSRVSAPPHRRDASPRLFVIAAGTAAPLRLEEQDHPTAQFHPPGLTPSQEWKRGARAASETETAFYSSAVRKGRRSERYRLEGVRGLGGVGTVLEVLDLDLERRVAMKILRPSWKHHLDVVVSFVTEAKITAFLEHPHILPIHELGLAREAGLFFTMKLAEGESLRDIVTEIERENAVYVARYHAFHLLGIFRKVCDAVACAHSNGLLHLDVKPQNVLVGRHGEVFLADWGLARVFRDPKQDADPVRRAFLSDILELTRERLAHVGGSPAYMAPEQARGEHRLLDQRTDIFLLGATLYHLFTLAPPYDGRDPIEALEKARRRSLIPPESRSPARQIPEEVCRIINKAMERQRADRYQTVEELAADIDAVMAGRFQPEIKREFAPGERLMTQGEIAGESYVILSGRVAVFTESEGQRIFLRECGPGDLVGELALIAHQPRSASVEALERTVVAVLTAQRLTEQLGRLPPYMERMVSALATQLRELSGVVHPHLVADCTEPVLRQLRLLLKASGAERLSPGAPIDQLVAQIAADLGLPLQRVREVLGKARDAGGTDNGA